MNKIKNFLDKKAMERVFHGYLNSYELGYCSYNLEVAQDYLSYKRENPSAKMTDYVTKLELELFRTPEEVDEFRKIYLQDKNDNRAFIKTLVINIGLELPLCQNYRANSEILFKFGRKMKNIKIL